MTLLIRLSSVLIFSVLLSACQGGDSEETSVEEVVIGESASGGTVNRQALVEDALKTGKLDTSLRANDVIKVLLSRYQQGQEVQQQVMSKMFADATQPISYDPYHRSQLVAITSSRTVPLLYSKASPDLMPGPAFAVYGTLEQGQYAYFATGLIQKIWQQKSISGTFPGKDEIDYQPFDTPMTHLMQSLLPENNDAPTLVFAFEDNGGYARAWFKDKFPQANIARCRLGTEFSNLDEFKTCIETADLLFVGKSPDNDIERLMSFDDIAAAVQAQLASGSSVYMEQNNYEHRTDFTIALAPIFGIAFPYQAGNYWDALTMASTPLSESGAFQAEIALLEHLRDGSFTQVDLSVCGDYKCPQSERLTQELLRLSDWWKVSLDAVDVTSGELFSQPDLDMVKLQVLLGDLLRQEIQYPVDPHADLQVFARAYLADHLNFYRRQVTPMQPDLGDFSYQHDALSKVSSQSIVDQLSDKVLDTNYVSQLNSDNELTRLTGYYLLPGSSITLKRTDSNSGEVYALINAQARGNTHEYHVSNQGVSDYQRPIYLQSPSFLLPVGEEVVLSTPYGGSLLIEQPMGSGDISVAIEGVYPYTFLDDFNDQQQIDNFVDSLASSPIKWLGIKSDFVEINAPKDRIEDTITNASYRGDVQLYMQDIWRYLIKGAYELAGFVDSASGLVQTAGVTATCQSMGWDCSDEEIHRKPKLQRINVDYNPRCGAACSGNPFDVTGLDPIGRLESHELGHGLQRSRMHILNRSGTRTTGETSNLLFERYKAWQYYQGKPGAEDVGINMIRARNSFLMLQCAQRGTSVLDTMQAVLWEPTGTYTNAAERLNFYGQLVMKADREQTQLGFSGWDIITLIYKHERLLSQALEDGDKAALDKLGLSLYSIGAADTISSNDYLLIISSMLFKQNMNAYFDAWGIVISDVAKQQVTALGYASAPLEYYYFDKDVWTEMGLASSKALAIDGTTPWPLNTGHARDGFSCDANGNYVNNLY
ncbi:ImpA family metalloprotease [Shewanella sp. Isolate11]|uniref:ImpA family metalloprotease n=1 Tax=Shewanella sp. Isolate11 TaxID=2908530 RepID=UPI001EFDAA98|nr:ImpA family metalloprotease [Shewanella sp. Isolate11]MCG9695856.1 ImpA family metalloprotease [Shewanella sp. Isolate11]